MKPVLMSGAFALLLAMPAAAAQAEEPTAAATQPGDLSMCDALQTEMDVLGARTEGQMIAMGERLGQMATQAVSDNKVRNAIQSQVGKLNWVVPGLGTALDMINSKVYDLKAKKRELLMERERVAATLSVEEAVTRMVNLSNELILNDCAEL